MDQFMLVPSLLSVADLGRVRAGTVGGSPLEVCLHSANDLALDRFDLARGGVVGAEEFVHIFLCLNSSGLDQEAVHCTAEADNVSPEDDEAQDDLIAHVVDTDSPEDQADADDEQRAGEQKRTITQSCHKAVNDDPPQSECRRFEAIRRVMNRCFRRNSAEHLTRV